MDERLEFLKRHQSFQSGFERTEHIREYGASRRPALMLNFAVSAGECETLRETAEFALDEAWKVARQYPDDRPVGNAKDVTLLDFYTSLAVTMVDSYDNCLGNP